MSFSRYPHNYEADTLLKGLIYRGRRPVKSAAFSRGIDAAPPDIFVLIVPMNTL